MNQLRIYIGTEPKTKIFEQVLRYSIMKHLSPSVNVEIVSMIGPEWEVPKGLHQGTGFSLRRFMIPQKCNYTGFAVYMDADMYVFGDMGGILDYGRDGDLKNYSGVACTYQTDKYHPKHPAPQSSLMLLDCSLCQDWQPDRLWRTLRGGFDYPKFMHLEWMKHKPKMIPKRWNRLNDYVPGDTTVLHYTKEPDQPTYNPDHPHAALWQAGLKETIAAGQITKADFEEALSKWGVKEDWRPTNGLHPFYRSYLPLFDQQVGQ